MNASQITNFFTFAEVEESIQNCMAGMMSQTELMTYLLECGMLLSEPQKAALTVFNALPSQVKYNEDGITARVTLKDFDESVRMQTARHNLTPATLEEELEKEDRQLLRYRGRVVQGDC